MLQDFTGFTYKNRHSIRDLNIYRVSNGSRYDFQLTPNPTDKSMEIPGNDGMYYFNSYYKSKEFQINIAFDKLSEQNLRELRQLFNSKEVGDFIFDETPYKTYSAKVSRAPDIKAICFIEKINGIEQRVYKGEGTISFICFNPYAHTPSKLWTLDDSNQFILSELDGKVLSNYNDLYYTNKLEWQAAADLLPQPNTDAVNYVKNNGELPAPFKVELDNITLGENGTGKTLSVGQVSIIVEEACSNFCWDSYTGMVSGEINSERRAIKHSGNPCGTIPNNKEEISLVGLDSSNIKYDFWYY